MAFDLQWWPLTLALLWDSGTKMLYGPCYCAIPTVSSARPMISLPYLYAVRTADVRLKRVNALVVPLCFENKRLAFAGVTLVRRFNLGQSKLDC